MNKKKALQYLIHCDMISRWGKFIQRAKKLPEENRAERRKKQLILTLAKAYYRNSQRGLTVIRGIKCRPPYCIYKKPENPNTILHKRIFPEKYEK